MGPERRSLAPARRGIDPPGPLDSPTSALTCLRQSGPKQNFNFTGKPCTPGRPSSRRGPAVGRAGRALDSETPTAEARRPVSQTAEARRPGGRRPVNLPASVLACVPVGSESEW